MLYGYANRGYDDLAPLASNSKRTQIGLMAVPAAIGKNGMISVHCLNIKKSPAGVAGL